MLEWQNIFPSLTFSTKQCQFTNTLVEKKKKDNQTTFFAVPYYWIKMNLRAGNVFPSPFRPHHVNKKVKLNN